MANDAEMCWSCRRQFDFEFVIAASEPLSPTFSVVCGERAPQVRVRRLSLGKVHWLSLHGRFLCCVRIVKCN